MPADKLMAYFKENKVKYKVIEHSEVYTAQEIAASAHIPGKQLAKTVMVKIDGEMAMAVLPASYRVDFKQLKKAIGAKKVELASEGEFKDMFPDCEVGAMPPFGHLYDMKVIVAESLTEEMVITFCGGSHTELIQISFQDFERLAKPKVVNFSIKG
ncbi:MAG: deacylase [Anaerolineales bacterium]|nr:deacylase [Anaerolineales bacterium]